MVPIPAKVVAALGAWASLILYGILMNGFLADVRALPDGATAAPKLDAGLVGFAGTFGTAVVGVIAGLAGVSIVQAGIRSFPNRLGTFLLPVPSVDTIAKIATGLYLFVYFGIAFASFLVWREHGTDLTPDFVRTQVVAAGGLLGAMAALNAAK